MSRGWESKSVEGDQEERVRTVEQQEAVSGTVLREEAALNRLADAQRARNRQSLELQRERILSERTSSPHRRSALSAALLEVEEKLSELGWTVHL